MSKNLRLKNLQRPQQLPKNVVYKVAIYLTYTICQAYSVASLLLCFYTCIMFLMLFC